MHPKDIEPFLKLIKDNDIAELEFQEGETRLKIVRATSGALGAPLIVGHPGAAPAAAEKPAATTEPPVETGNVVTSPFVGTFYRASSPDSPPFTDVGASVSTGQILCIVEAMKLMNEIESDFSGVVKKIFVENGQPVEYGDKLFLIE